MMRSFSRGELLSLNSMSVKSVVTLNIFSKRRMIGYVNRMKRAFKPAKAIFVRYTEGSLYRVIAKPEITSKYVIKIMPGVMKKNCDRF